MWRAACLFAILSSLTLPAARAQANKGGARAAPSGKEWIDGIAARIEDDVITESEVRELAAYQQLLEGRVASRDNLLSELIDQWIVRKEAEGAHFPHPLEEEVAREIERIARPYSSAEAFRARLAELNLSETALRRLVGRQLYLTRFLDYRFRPVAQVGAKQIEAYYRQQFVPQLEQRGQPVPSLNDVEGQIREVLTQKEISGRAARWLDEARARLRIDITPGGDRS